MFITDRLITADGLEARWTTSKARCWEEVRYMNSVKRFEAFVHDLDSTKKDEKRVAELVNSCLRSSDGLLDLITLNGIFQQLKTIHSVCEPDFIDQLLDFKKQMRENGLRSKTLKRRLSHGFTRIFTLFTGQVILTCKRSLETKLERAEQLDESLRQSLQIIENTEEKVDEFRTSVESILQHKTTSVLPEDIFMAESIKHSNGSQQSFPLTLRSEETLERFLDIKKACKSVDKYALSSIYPIARLSLRGYRAGDDDDEIDEKLKSSSRVARWLNAVEYCQSVYLIKVQLDVEREIPESLQQEVLDDEATKEIDWHKFEEIETFDDIGWDLKCFLASPDVSQKGVKGWILKRFKKDHQKQIA